MKTGFLIGGPIVALALAFALQLNGRVKLTDKKHLVYILFGSLLLGLVGLTGFIKIGETFERIVVTQLLFLVAGTIHFGLLNMLTQENDKLNSLQSILLTLLIAILGGLFFALMFSLTMASRLSEFRLEDFPVVLGITSLCFVLPTVMFLSAEAYKLIPEALYKSWRYPGDDYYPNLKFQQLIPFRITLFVKITDASRRTYKIRNMPVESTFGDIFFQFVYENQQREVAEKQIDIYLEEENSPEIQWSFKVLVQLNKPGTWFRKIRFLDPDKNLTLNKIRPDDLILAKRIFIQRPS